MSNYYHKFLLRSHSQWQDDEEQQSTETSDHFDQSMLSDLMHTDCNIWVVMILLPVYGNNAETGPTLGNATEQ